jgi:thiol-disulfide isomerase/thioredoxin
MSSFLLVAALLMFSNSVVDDNAALLHAKATDKEIQDLPNLPETTRSAAFRSMMQRIRNQPKRYRLALASNLAVSAGEVVLEPAIVQSIANLLVDELQESPEKASELATDYLADFAFYRHIKVSFDSPLYRADIADREAEAKVRAAADFTLMDTKGKRWHWKGLRGNFVLLNFWATWCPPCQRELPVLEAVYNHYVDNGLVVLAITEEDLATVNHYLASAPLPFPVLPDTAGVTEKQFLVKGFPHSILYNRNGEMTAEFPGPVTKKEVQDALTQAGLR